MTHPITDITIIGGGPTGLFASFYTGMRGATAQIVDALPELGGRATLHAGLGAVIEDARGMLSYWALAHRAAQPDFHDPRTFRLRLGAR